jgi:hypothetical protein
LQFGSEEGSSFPELREVIIDFGTHFVELDLVLEISIILINLAMTNVAWRQV